jgi:N-acetylneuraminate lyase
LSGVNVKVKIMPKLQKFKGLMAPVFTPFAKNYQINYSAIEPYAELLKSKGISAILVNGTSGEGMLLSVDERKRVTEKWQEACKKHNILMMVQISGCPFVDVIELAKHAAEKEVDGVLCLPELYFKPKTISKLVNYLNDIAIHCPDIPLYYYHIPMFTQVDLPMAEFMLEAKTKISNFAGIKYTSGDLEKGLACLQDGLQVFLGADTILLGALALGFDSAIMTSLNIIPEQSIQILELMKEGKVDQARELQMQINEFVKTTLKDGGGDWVTSMKKAFNKKFVLKHLGPVRKPL